MTFSLHQCGVVITSPITHTIVNIHPLAHIPDICALIFNGCAPFQFTQLHHVTPSHPSPGDYPAEHGRAVRKNAGPCKNGRVKLNHLYISSLTLHFILSLAHCRASYTAIHPLQKAIFTPSIQPNRGLPRTRPPLTVHLPLTPF